MIFLQGNKFDFVKSTEKNENVYFQPKNEKDVFLEFQLLLFDLN